VGVTDGVTDAVPPCDCPPLGFEHAARNSAGAAPSRARRVNGVFIGWGERILRA